MAASYDSWGKVPFPQAPKLPQDLLGARPQSPAAAPQPPGPAAHGPCPWNQESH
jgi:hypothetical protein